MSAAKPKTDEDRKRAAAARKAALTRKANDERKEADKKKAAAARKRKATLKKKEEEEAAKKKKAAAARAKGARNPRTMAGFLGALKGAAKMGALLLPVMAASNWLANRETKKDGRVTTWAQRVGPLFHVGISLGALALVPRYLLKGRAMSKYKPFATTALQALVVFNVLRLVAFLARRKWSFSEPAIPVGDKAYPGWTNLIELQAPLPMLKAPAEADVNAEAAPVAGPPYYDAAGRQHHHDAMGHPGGGQYGRAGMGGPVEMEWDNELQEFVPVAA